MNPNRLMLVEFFVALLMCVQPPVTAAPSNSWVRVSNAFDRAIATAAFNKDGLERMQRPDYQYEIIGLGGTTMRPNPLEMTSPDAPGIPGDAGLDYRPYLGYEYWWDGNAHRVTPFELTGGYSDGLDTGNILSFHHEQKLQNSMFTINADLEVRGIRFHTRRQLFVTPEGVLVLRVTDGAGAPQPFRLKFGLQQPWNQGSPGTRTAIYNSLLAEPQGASGMIEIARRTNACTATLAVATDQTGTVYVPEKDEVSTARAGEETTFFLAPGSSYENDAPARSAWQKVEAARKKRFERLLDESRAWWRDFYGRSAVEVPDATVMKWFVRSLYYQVFFWGNTKIPPGCFGTCPGGFEGCICPEFNLPFSQLALLYTDHVAEARNVTDWLIGILPKAEQLAHGASLYKTHVAYPGGGALYGTLIGYDGTLRLPGQEWEGEQLYSKYPEANCAAMALAYLDWTQDAQRQVTCLKILKQETQLCVQDLQYDPQRRIYFDKTRPHSLNAAAIEFCLRESLKRGVGELGWEKFYDQAEHLHSTYHGKPTLFAGSMRQNSGDAPSLQYVWWYGLRPATNPAVANTYDVIRHSRTGSYVFNNGWMAVIAAKLRRAEDAYEWVKNLVEPGPGLPLPNFDDTCLGEFITNSKDDFRKTPETAAHAALICAVTQMLLDPDSSDSIEVFPALPKAWQADVAFSDLAAKGGVLVSAEQHAGHIKVRLVNPTDQAQTRNLSIGLPADTRRIVSPANGASLKNGRAVFLPIFIPAHGEFKVTLEVPSWTDTQEQE